MAGHSKRYTDSVALLTPDRLYTVQEAVDLIKSFPDAKFDETVEVVMFLGIDPKQSDQQVRGTISLPHGTGKSITVLVFAEGEGADQARAAGAEHVGGADLVKKVEEGWTDFDLVICSPALMRIVGKLGKVLGPQGKMPSPKSGTVTDDVGKAVREFKAGKIEYRNDSTGNIHAPVGKKSFPAQSLAENLDAFINHIKVTKPAAAKGSFVKKIGVSTTMSPGIPLAIS